MLVRAGTVVTLSGRERDVAVLAAGGLSSRAIAAELLLSVRTVDNHLGRVYAKLGVSSRAAAGVNTVWSAPFPSSHDSRTARADGDSGTTPARETRS